MKKFLLILSTFLSFTLFTNSALAFETKELIAAGPGDRIHGMDISYWQHPSGSSIDFRKMYAAGVRFVLIKGADAHDKADAQALKYLKIDRPAAQAARLYTCLLYTSPSPRD